MWWFDEGDDPGPFRLLLESSLCSSDGLGWLDVAVIGSSVCGFVEELAWSDMVIARQCYASTVLEKRIQGRQNMIRMVYLQRIVGKEV